MSLSDRFGLWLGFHNVDQDTYQAIVRGYAAHYGLDLPAEQLQAEANEWSITRGARSGRVAWQFIQDLAGRLGKTAWRDPGSASVPRLIPGGAGSRREELARIDRLLAAAQLEMQLRLADPAGRADLAR